MDAYQKLVARLNDAIEPLSKNANQYDAVLEQIGDCRFVLMGEATHGTKEFYEARAEITRLLIEKKGFMAVAIEGDWPDAYSVHRYIQGADQDEKQALNSFKRFPIWMWRNTSLPPFLKWLRHHNDQIALTEKVGFYGLDLYSLYTSMQAVIDYLEEIDPTAALRAKSRYACFDHKQTDPQSYGYLTALGEKDPCIKEVTSQLLDLQSHAFEHMRHDGISLADKHFYAVQNARLVKNAESYYRGMFESRVSTWNIRDSHMVETLNVIADHLENRSQKPAKIVVWAHNSHVGDARATEVSEGGEINIGQLVREQHDADVYLLGFSTYQGFVTAASDWGSPAERKPINPGFESSYEELFHHLKHDNFFLSLRNQPELEHLLKIPRLQRAIGVIYRPDSERFSHYYFANLPRQFDGIIHFDQTTAVEPLEINPEWR